VKRIKIHPIAEPAAEAPDSAPDDAPAPQTGLSQAAKSR
jgi:hypothetical protein